MKAVVAQPVRAKLETYNLPIRPHFFSNQSSHTYSSFRHTQFTDGTDPCPSHQLADAQTSTLPFTSKSWYLSMLIKVLLSVGVYPLGHVSSFSDFQKLV
jgi:hypothetical protein